MGKAKARIVVKALTDTAIEKILVLGANDAAEDVERLRGVVHDLVEFWGIGEPLDVYFDAKVDGFVEAQAV